MCSPNSSTQPTNSLGTNTAARSPRPEGPSDRARRGPVIPLNPNTTSPVIAVYMVWLRRRLSSGELRAAPPDNVRALMSRADGGPQRSRHGADLVLGDAREHRQRQDALRQALGHRELAASVAEVLEGRLQVDRGRVVNAHPDAGGAELSEHPVAVVDL